jgi:hypothetical protein
MAKKLTRAEKIRRYLKANPNMPLKDVAARFDTTYQIVYMTKKTMKEDTPDARLPKLKHKEYSYVWVDTNKLDKDAKDKLAAQLLVPTPVEDMNTRLWDTPIQADPVNHPAHYKTGGIETIDFIEAKELNYNMGNAVKYISRAEHKGNKKQDLEKAVWYLNRELNKTKE